MNEINSKAKIEPFLIPEGSISPGGSAAIGIKDASNDYVLLWCAGSGKTLRDAKAATLRNLRSILKQTRALEV